MREETADRAVILGEYILDTGATVRATAKVFKISKSPSVITGKLFLRVIRFLTLEYTFELKGKYKGFRECHIQPDWLLIYLLENDVLTLTLVDTGTHADLFDM